MNVNHPRTARLRHLAATAIPVAAMTFATQAPTLAQHEHETTNSTPTGVVGMLSNWDHSTPFIREAEDGGVFIGDVYFDSWEAYFASDLFLNSGGRCGLELDPDFDELLLGPSDCSYNNTNPDPQYDPSVALFRIPVVFHVLRASNGTTGNVPKELIDSQMEVLNEDFLAIMGSNGENGTDCQIQFYLATTDPDGNPTDGVTYSNNTTWYNDQGSYWNSLAWDPDRYMNVYTNTASGALGYVPWLPQNGNVGSNADRIVVLWSAVGRNAPIGPPYNLGRTLTHEVGHFLGLFHTFQSGCGGNCSTNGDRVCDTNEESSPHYGCGARNTCSSPDPIENYMDYSDDRCMDNFTPDQARRMRCTLEFYRPDVYEAGPGYQLSLLVDELVAGQIAGFRVDNGDAGQTCAVVWGNEAGESTFENYGGWCITFEFDVPANKATSRIVGQGSFNGSGTFIVSRTIPGNVQGATLFFQAAQRDTCPDQVRSEVETRTVQ